MLCHTCTPSPSGTAAQQAGACSRIQTCGRSAATPALSGSQATRCQAAAAQAQQQQHQKQCCAPEQTEICLAYVVLREANPVAAAFRTAYKIKTLPQNNHGGTSLSSSSIMRTAANQANTIGAVILLVPCHRPSALLWQLSSPAAALPVL